LASLSDIRQPSTLIEVRTTTPVLQPHLTMAVCRAAIDEERRFPLFDLPPELRAWIFDHVIADPQLVPAKAAAATSEVDVQTIHFSIERPRLNNMCLVSKQFRHEYLQRVDRQTTIVMLDHKDFQFADYHPNGSRFHRVATSTRHLEIRMFATCANMCGDLADECDILRLQQFLSETLPRFSALQSVVIRMGIWSSEQATELDWPASEHSKNLQEFLEQAKITALAKLSSVEIYNSEREWQDFETAFCPKRLSATWTRREGWKPIIRPKKKKVAEKLSLDQATQQAAQIVTQTTVTTAPAVTMIAYTQGTAQHLNSSSIVDNSANPHTNLNIFTASAAPADRIPSVFTEIHSMMPSTSVTAAAAATSEDEITVAAILAGTAMMSSTAPQPLPLISLPPSNILETIAPSIPQILPRPAEQFTSLAPSLSTDLAWVDLNMNDDVGVGYLSPSTDRDTDSAPSTPSPPTTPSLSDSLASPITPMTELSSPDMEMRSSTSVNGSTVKNTDPLSHWAQPSTNFSSQQAHTSQELTLPAPSSLFSGGCCHHS
jgi:hypothetical protein